MMTPSGSSPIIGRIQEKRSALEGAKRTGSSRLDFGDGPDMDFDLGEIDTDLLDRLLDEEESDPPAERIREGRARPQRYAGEAPYVAAQPPPEAPARWEELTETDSGYLLRHDGRIFAAVEIDAGAVVSQAFGSAPAKAAPRADATPAPAPSRKRNAKGHYVKETPAGESFDNYA